MVLQARDLPDGITEQPFEAEFLGGPVWRLTSTSDLSSLVADAAARGVRLISIRVPEGAAGAPELLAAGFRHIETLVTMERAVTNNGGEAAAADVRGARPDDVDACAAIAARGFRHDRFHSDPAIPAAAADAVKSRWVRNAFAGRADAILVVERDSRVVGFILLLLRGEAAAVDLIAVAPETRGAGLGKALLRGALRFCAGRATVLRAGTQVANRESLSMYAAAGFQVVRRDMTFHWTPARLG